MVDAGFLRMTSPTAKFFNGAQGFTQLRNEDEVYLGIVLPKSFLQPALYANYGFNLDQIVVEGSLYHEFKEVGPFKLDMTLRGFVGTIAANDALDDGSGAQNGYAYAGAGLDFSKQVGQGSVIGVGVNYAVNNDEQPATRESQVWTGSSPSSGSEAFPGSLPVRGELQRGQGAEKAPFIRVLTSMGAFPCSRFPSL